MKALALAFISWMGASALLAAELPPQRPCDPMDTTQLGMNDCAHAAFVESDRKLNETYQALIRKERSSRVYIAKLREAQKAWIAFRDAEVAANFACELDDTRACFGSMYGMSLNYFKKKLTDERQARLQELLEKGRETT